MRGMDKSTVSPNYQAMAEFRYQIRRFLRFSEQAARESGVEPKQYQLMLALKGLPGEFRPRIGELAERLQIQHHSTVELVNRLATRGYIRRHKSDLDKREVLVSLTPSGEKVLRELALDHQAEIKSRGPDLVAALKRIMIAARSSNHVPRVGKRSVKRKN